MDNLIQKRINLSKGISYHIPPFPPLAVAALNTICARIEPVFLAPIVYRVDLDVIPSTRRRISGSGGTGSNEYLVSDLGENEFDVLFFDTESDGLLQDGDLKDLGNYIHSGSDILDMSSAFFRLWQRVR